jgi:hypothetical protein
MDIFSPAGWTERNNKRNVAKAVDCRRNEVVSQRNAVRGNGRIKQLSQMLLSNTHGTKK